MEKRKVRFKKKALEYVFEKDIPVISPEELKNEWAENKNKFEKIAIYYENTKSKKNPDLNKWDEEVRLNVWALASKDQADLEARVTLHKNELEKLDTDPETNKFLIGMKTSFLKDYEKKLQKTNTFKQKLDDFLDEKEKLTHKKLKLETE
ncbi:MAG: hypothetical protein AB7R69_05465 [Candidatus Babeliales bacterium]